MDKTSIKKTMLIGEILDMDMSIAPILMASGMHCIGCPASAGETLEEACMVHGLDADEMVTKIDEFLKGKAAYEEAQEKARQEQQ